MNQSDKDAKLIVIRSDTGYRKFVRIWIEWDVISRNFFHILNDHEILKITFSRFFKSWRYWKNHINGLARRKSIISIIFSWRQDLDLITIDFNSNIFFNFRNENTFFKYQYFFIIDFSYHSSFHTLCNWESCNTKYHHELFALTHMQKVSNWDDHCHSIYFSDYTRLGKITIDREVIIKYYLRISNNIITFIISDRFSTLYDDF